MEADPSDIRVEIGQGVAQVDAASWDRLTVDAPPFVEHAFLASLEEAGCVGAEAGWLPVPLMARDEQTHALLGAAPAYIKTHSMGEFVYDWSWADAAERSGVPYYPKLVVAAPFSPVSGPRLLVDASLRPEAADAVRRALLSGCVQAARQMRCAGVHVLFCTERERDLAVEMGFAARTGMQFHWRNEGYATFDDFLARFRSKRRNQIRRERRRVRDSGVTIRSVTGGALDARHREAAFGFYAATVDRFTWGRRYLNERFFELLWERMPDRVQLLLAEDRSGELVAGTVNMQRHGRRYGRYWGATGAQDCLHFEVCSYGAIDDCIQRGLQVFEAGAGGGSHKYGRGFAPALTWSAHLHLHRGFHAALADFCLREAAHIRAEATQLAGALFVR